MRTKKFLIGGLIVCLAIGYLGFLGFQSSATYYYSVSELTEQGSTIYDENVRVKGQVAPGSVEQGTTGNTLKFIVIEGGTSLPVTYQGVVPDTFGMATEIVIEGQLNSTGTFQAHTLMPKCPSKYVPQQ
ncbi:MAG: cytochrome c maturation protein CcmE [Dehalococcoidales bacterium]|jgi:cytochrome c-type biogenesis protein CcmE|nr:cytochrome c biogenesis protein CcmE [Dehalococcoidales bacterium]MDP6042865.1 cytochrome c maturation protein CcmE [Dehalococcoidales bacterium]MDP6577178.1 cytochrome c maturation protein CcmE [Dehalococcoidales bacterium]MDP7416208.1 cytochrome c maturation protein CcmE [Dehalococcoidales bacterium]